MFLTKNYGSQMIKKNKLLIFFLVEGDFYFGKNFNGSAEDIYIMNSFSTGFWFSRKYVIFILIYNLVTFYITNQNFFEISNLTVMNNSECKKNDHIIYIFNIFVVKLCKLFYLDRMIT